MQAVTGRWLFLQIQFSVLGINGLIFHTNTHTQKKNKNKKNKNKFNAIKQNKICLISSNRKMLLKGNEAILTASVKINRRKSLICVGLLSFIFFLW